MITFVQVLDFIGTFAFAISGIRLASAKQFDWFGAYVVGMATAIGGGTIRDVLLDVTPGWMTDPIYLICTGLALFWVIAFGKYLIHMHNTFFLFDSIGLALFTVVGVGKSIALGYPYWVAIIMGSITGAAGGVIRDVFINEIPLIFRKEIYAMACVVGVKLLDYSNDEDHNRLVVTLVGEPEALRDAIIEATLPEWRLTDARW